MKTQLPTTAIAVLITVLAAAAVDILGAQSPPDASLPSYEASVKRNTTSGGMISMRGEPAGRTVTGMPLRQLIVQSYGIQQSQLIGGPDWLMTDRWDIQLRADSAVTPAQVNLLMQQMMADRFKLVIHRETRDLPVFELRMARTDGTPGPELKPATIDCGPQGRGRSGPPPPAPGAAGGGAAIGRGAPGGGPLAGCRMMLALGRVEAMGQPLAPLISFLSNQLGRPVIDRTGLTGNFDLVLSWNPEGGRGLTGGPLPPGVELPPVDPNAPSLVTALQEQLGLKVESTRGPVEVLVIDSVQQPSEN